MVATANKEAIMPKNLHKFCNSGITKDNQEEIGCLLYEMRLGKN